MERAQGFAMQGARVVWTMGLSSQTLVQESAPYARITVYLTGTTTLATLFSDNQVPPTYMANPFTANENGYWFFYAVDGRYDVMIQAAEWAWTIGDLLLEDGGRWTADQNANGHWLHDLGGISFLNGQCHLSIALDANCNLLFTGAGGNTLLSLSPQGDLSIPGNLNVGGGAHIGGPLQIPSLVLNNGVCSATIDFDANCFVVVHGSLGVTGNFDVNGLANLAGDLKVDGSFTLRGPWITDQNANGHMLFGLGILGVDAIHLSHGNCTAELGLDDNCNTVLTGDLVVSGNLTVKGQSVGTSVTHQDIAEGRRAWNTVYQNTHATPMFVAVSCNLGPNDGVIAMCDANNPPGTDVGVVQSVSQDFTLTMVLPFWVLPGYFYKLDTTRISTNPDWPPLLNHWTEWY